VKRLWLPITLLTSAGVLAACGSAAEGPLSNLGADPMGFSIPLDVGESASISGPFVVKNLGNGPIHLDGVQLIGLQKGLALRGAYIVPYPQHPSGPRPRSATIGLVTGYHPSRGDRILDGATVAPHTQLAIVLGVEAAKVGRHAWTAVDVTYHDGMHAYTLRSPVAARICAPKALYVGENGRDCPAPDPLKSH
jgi:hypothetical protein